MRERDAMIVAGVVIETTPGAAPRVATRLRGVEGVELHGSDGDHRLAAVIVGAGGATLEVLARRLVAADPEVLGILPTYVADERAYGAAAGERADRCVACPAEE